MINHTVMDASTNCSVKQAFIAEVVWDCSHFQITALITNLLYGEKQNIYLGQ